MFTRKLLPVLFLLSAITVAAQKNFQYTPEKPQAGDKITIIYEPAGDLANILTPVEGIVYLQGNKNAAEDIILKREGNKYTGTIQTDTSQNFLYLGFSTDQKKDNNYNEGYWIQLYDGDKIKKGSNFSLAQFYQYYGSQVGVDKNNEKALSNFEKEFSLYPETRKTYLATYLRLVTSVKKEEAPAIVQKEIEAILKAGLKDETDYNLLENLYAVAKLPEQAKMITGLKKEKYPVGKWVITETVQKFYNETDPVKKEQLLADIVKKTETDENWKDVKKSIPGFKLEIAYAYVGKKDWESVKKAIAAADMSKEQKASLYNNIAWEMQGKSNNLDDAFNMSKFATDFSKSELTKPTSTRPPYYTAKQWEKGRERTYAMYADTYAMVLYRKREYKKALPFAKEAAIKINKGNSADLNNTYALVAEKALPLKQFKKELEQFVKDGKSTGEIKEILKRAYVKEKKSENGFDEYIAALEKESYLKMLAELKKSMLSETAPSFALLDLDGKNINIADLKGKVVVVDFWATWCGPCKASFPGMQKMVNKYKERPDVRFVFIDTWERADNKEKNASEFVTSNKYTFHVLMDNDNKVVDQFKVEGIPTKFVIDKNGLIRFKAVGFDGSDDKLISELTAMIDMAADAETKKAF
jgi:thiol-disulfide isomerase/thioredoxin